jgi:hypothetical protein
MKIKFNVLTILIPTIAVLSCNKITTKSNISNAPSKPPDPCQLANFKTDGVKYGNFWEYGTRDTAQHADYFYFNSAAYGPFSSRNEFIYALPNSCGVKIDVYNVNGTKVDSTEFDNRRLCIYKLKYDFSKIPSGVYYLKLMACDTSGVVKMTILK